MTHENLYRVADALQVRARWLAVGDTASTQIDLGDGDIIGLIGIYEAMPVAAREQWLAIGRTLLSMHTVGRGTEVDPYSKLSPLRADSDQASADGAASTWRQMPDSVRRSTTSS